jgi:hypothetical protein
VIKNKWLKYEDYRIYTESLEDEYSAFYLSSESASFECTELIFNLLFEKKLLDKITNKPSNWKPFNLVKLTEKILFTKNKDKFKELYKFVEEVSHVQDDYLVTIMSKLKRAGHIEQVSWLIEYDETLLDKLQEREKQRQQVVMQGQYFKSRRNDYQNRRFKKHNNQSRTTGHIESSSHEQFRNSNSQRGRVNNHSAGSQGSSGSQESLNQDEQEYYNLYFQYFPSSRSSLPNNGHYSSTRYSR